MAAPSETKENQLSRKKKQLARDKEMGISTFNVRAYDEDKETIKKFAKWLFEQREAEKGNQD